jgi:7-cyano-7-deazaguanine synthase
MIDCLVVLSGGMDSTVLFTDCVNKYEKVAAVSFDYGSKHNDCEIPLAKEICNKVGVAHRVISLPFIGDLFSSSLLSSGEPIPDGSYDQESMKSTVVPFRNGIMLSIAAGYAESIGAAVIVLGSHSGDHFIYPDCRPDFNATFAKAVSIGTDNKVSIEFPYSSIDKRDIGDLGRKLGVDFSRTWTCYKGGEIHCGTCGACDERKYALRKDEGLDPTKYRA